MKVIIKDKFYEFQNEKTDIYFEEQKQYLTNLIQKYESEDNQEALYTALFSLYNLSEALISKIVDEKGENKVISDLNAKQIN